MGPSSDGGIVQEMKSQKLLYESSLPALSSLDRSHVGSWQVPASHPFHSLMWAKPPLPWGTVAILWVELDLVTLSQWALWSQQLQKPLFDCSEVCKCTAA